MWSQNHLHEAREGGSIYPLDPIPYWSRGSMFPRCPCMSAELLPVNCHLQVSRAVSTESTELLDCTCRKLAQAFKELVSATGPGVKCDTTEVLKYVRGLHHT